METTLTNLTTGSSNGKEYEPSAKTSSEAKFAHEKLDVHNIFRLPEIEVTSGSQEVKKQPVPRKQQPKSKLAPKPTPKRASEDYSKIMRQHYLNVIVKAVKGIQPHAGTSHAISYIHTILHAIHDFDKESPDDAIMEVLLAFYNALAYKSQWIDYNTQQFEQAHEIFQKITREPINSTRIEKVINALADAGFNILPFELVFDDND